MIPELIAGALLILAAFIAYGQYLRFAGREVAEGRVASLQAEADSEGSTTYKIVAEFPDRDGRIRTYRSGFSSSSPGYRVGDRIRIYFDREHPEQCGILSFGYRFGVAWAFACVAVLILLIRYGYILGNAWLETHVPTTVPSGFDGTLR